MSPEKKSEAPATGFDAHIAGVLAYYQKQYEDGDNFALLEALRLSLVFDVRAPDWVRYHVEKAISKYSLYEHETLDDAFKVKRSKDPRARSANKRAITLIGEVTQFIWKARDAGQPLNDLFFTKVGRQFGIGRSKVKEYWKAGNATLPFKGRAKKSRRKR